MSTPSNSRSSSATGIPSRPPTSPLRTASGASINTLYSQSTLNTPTQLNIPVPNTAVPVRRSSLVPAELNPPGVGAVGNGAGAVVAGSSQHAHKNRNKDLLRTYYGMGLGPPPSKTGGNSTNSNNPMDMNSTAFDAKSYYDQLITTHSLPALLKRENELLSEIRQLDSERQSLVYNHHHDLIKASDTISAMKTRAESLDAELDHLKSAFSEISRLASEVSLEHATITNGRPNTDKKFNTTSTKTSDDDDDDGDEGDEGLQ